MGAILDAESKMKDFFGPLLILAVVVFFLVLFGITIKWCVKDARRRGKSPLLVSIAVIFFFPWGLIAWLIFRPNPLEGQRFRLENYRAQ
jgi:uncharacterized membrane protein YbhN (UPF0104 family)